MTALPPHTDRSLVSARTVTSDDGRIGLELGCDCGQATVYWLDPADLAKAVAGTAELAVTCGGCQTARWFTARASLTGGTEQP